MRKFITGAFDSLDGIMQPPGGHDDEPSGGFKYGGWVEPLVDRAARQVRLLTPANLRP